MVDESDNKISSPLDERIEKLERKVQGLKAENASLVESLIESRRSEESLSETVISYQRGLQSSGISLAIVDSDMVILDANEAIERLTGFKLIDLRNQKKWTDLVANSDKAKLDFYLKMSAENRESPPPNYEFKITDRSGNSRSVIVNIKPIPRSPKYVATFIDVSLLKRTEQALRDAEEKFLALFDNALDLIYVHDFEGRFLDANEQALSILGFKRHEIGELSFMDILDDPSDLQRAMASAASIYTNGRLDESAEWKLRRRDGGTIWVELTGSRIDREGKPYAIIGIGRDVTERRRAKAKLQASEQRFRSMFTHASEMIYMFDQAGRFIDANDRTLELLGCTRKEIRGLTIRDIVDPQDIGLSMDGLQRLFLEGEPQGPVELRFRLDDGTRKLMDVTTVRLDLGDGAHAALGIARDITARRDAEEKLRQAAEQMRSSQKMEAVGRLASGLSHEFSNVLNVIGGHSELALENLHDEDPIKENLDEISKAASSGANLTRQLLAFSSTQLLKPEVIDTDKHVSNVGTMLRRLIGEDVELIMKLGDSGKVRADPAQIEQVILNLAVNARDAMPRGGKLIIETYDADLDDEYASSHAGVKPGGYVIVAVTDTGDGMDEKTRQRIFEPFFSTKDQDIGSGLGLSTVFGIVKQSGGNVWVYSEKGRGSTFKIYLPRLEQEQFAERDSKPELGSLLGVETVLVVEDEDMVRNIVGMTLREHGYTVFEARNAEEALEIFVKGKRTIDVVVSDVVMPGMNGKELAEKLAADFDHHRILLVSGYPGTAATQQQLISDGVEFVSKPVAARTLVGKVRDLLDRPVRKN